VSAPTTARLGPRPVSDWTQKDRDQLSSKLRRADQFFTGQADAPPMPAILGLFAWHASLGTAFLGLTAMLMEHGVLDPQERELLVLQVGRRTGSAYCTDAHVRIANEVGLSPAVVGAVQSGADLSALDERARLLLRTADELIDNHAVSDATWQELSLHYDERTLLELLFVVGTYVCLSMVTNSVGLQPADRRPREDEA
jgi:4-carboxymuconolactone decarboxylase